MIESLEDYEFTLQRLKKMGGVLQAPLYRSSRKFYNIKVIIFYFRLNFCSFFLVIVSSFIVPPADLWCKFLVDKCKLLNYSLSATD